VTYSIVARDPQTGELGAAVQSHWFSVGPIVPWARPGIGAVATQANVEPAYGPRLLDLIAEGVDGPSALARLVEQDTGAHGRQVAVVDATGRVAAYTGPECMAYAGHVTGEAVSCQANIMASETVWGAMLETFNATRGQRLQDRLLAALDAAEAEGGDIRGRQSAAILVVPAEGEAWESTVCLRVEDHPAPLVELRRVMRLHDAYALAGQGDTMLSERRYDEASKLYRDAVALAPEAIELRFWAGIAAAQLGDLDTAVAEVRAVIEEAPRWGELIGRLPEAVMPSISAVRDGLGIAGS
jgi:uncharacterized Ntn-hydrolase superfamily protein